MRRIALFGEDFAHEKIIESLVRRLAEDFSMEIELDWRSARQGHGMVTRELKQYLQDLEAQPGQVPDLIIVATDANCMGFNKRIQELQELKPTTKTIYAVPNPHIERWLLLDSQAFKNVLGRGCDAPDQKCERGRYKRLLANAIRSAGVDPPLGGLEFAEGIIRQINIRRASGADKSFGNFVDNLRTIFRGWRT